ncbi:hypothetical protein HY631_02490 [Candidatus Uhrbacteria bacterium]|nr:hypothetical protein [Candidatus Uhrbacteria bacterium]
MLFLLQSLAFAGWAQDTVTFCMDRYESEAAVAACVAEPRFQAIEAAQATIEDRLAQDAQADREILERVSELSDSVAKLTREAVGPSVPAAPVPQATTGYNAVGGVPYQTLARPSLVSIYQALEDVEAHTLHVVNLGERSAYTRCGGIAKARVLVTNYGIPVPVWAPPGAPSGFTEVYVVGDDGPPVARKVLDPARHSAFYVTARSGDDLRVTYLREADDVVAVAGLPLMTLWRAPTRRDNSTTGVVACDMDSLESAGGHRQIQASMLSRVW